MDYSKLSDTTLHALHSGKPLDYGAMSDDELKELHSAASPAAPEDAGIADAALRGAGHVAFGEQIGGGLEALGDKLSGSHPEESLLEGYRRHRDAFKQKYETSHENHPIASTLGEVGGGVGLGLLTGGLGEAAGIGSLASPIARGAAQGALDAGLMGASTSDADLTKGQVGQFAGDVGKSALGGAALGGVMGKVGDLLTPQSLREGALKAGEAHLRFTPKVKERLGPEGVRAAVGEALDSGGIQFGNKAADTSASLKDLAREVGQVKGDLVDASDAKINPLDVADRIRREVIDPLRGNSENKSIIAKLEGKLKDFVDEHAPNVEGRAPGSPAETVTSESPSSIIDPSTNKPFVNTSAKELPAVPEASISPAQLEAEKTAAQNKINYKADPKQTTDADKAYARVLKESGEDAMMIKDPQTGEMIKDPAFQGAKDAYGNLINAHKAAARTASLTAGGGLLGHITDVGVGGVAAGAILHGNPAGLLLAGARMATKGRVASSAAVTMNKLSQLATQAPQMLGPYAGVIANAAARGPAALSVTHFLLSQRNQDYREMTDKLANDSK